MRDRVVDRRDLYNTMKALAGTIYGLAEEDEPSSVQCPICCHGLKALTLCETKTFR